MGDVEPVEQIGQRRAGGEFRVYVALLLRFDAAFAQQRDDRAVVFVLEEAMDFMGDFQTDVGQVDEHVRQCTADSLQRT